MVAQPDLPPREKVVIRTPPVRLRSLPRDVRWALAAGLVAAILGAVWLFVPQKPRRPTYLLGSLDRKPAPGPTARPKPDARPQPTPRPRPPGATVLGTPLPALPRP